VLLSTRGNGKIQTIYPIVNQFDYVICSVTVNGKTLYLDATDRFRPYQLLPYRALNHTGMLVVKDTKPQWVTIEPTGKSKAVTFAQLSLADDGSLKGKFQMKHSEYDAISERKKLADMRDEKYAKSSVESETMGFIVDSFYISNKDSVVLPFAFEASVSSTSYTQVLEDFMYVNPMTIERTKENPFKLEKRNFPVDFAYPVTSSYTLNLSIPETYELKELPKDINYRLPNNGGSYSRRSELTGTLLQSVVQFELNQTLFQPREYKSLREFFQQIVMAESEQLVLQKKQVTVTPTDGKK
jgi:hypothetical protein